MLLSTLWALPICAVLSLYRPVSACLDHAISFDTQEQRWLLFFLCTSMTVVPLHLVTLFGMSLPFRWESSIVALSLYSYDDARGAQLVFVKYVAPFVKRLTVPAASVIETSPQHILEEMRQIRDDGEMQAELNEEDPSEIGECD